MREYDCTFRNSIDITGKVKIGQIFQEIFVKGMKTAQIFDIIRRESKIFDVLNDLFQTTVDSIGSSTGIIAVENVEDY